MADMADLIIDLLIREQFTQIAPQFLMLNIPKKSVPLSLYNTYKYFRHPVGIYSRKINQIMDIHFTTRDFAYDTITLHLTTDWLVG